MDIILLDSSTKTKEEINIIKPKTYKKLLKKLEEEFEELPENYELFILDKTNKEIKISKESDFKKIGDILFVREIIKDNLDKSLYELNYNKLSESKQEILDDKYNCILCTIVIKNEKPYICYKCQKLFHEKCLTDWDNECKAQNKNLVCPNCRNELPLNQWNKKLDYEDDKKFITNLINKINENDNMNKLKDEKIDKLEKDNINQKNKNKKYEKYIEKTFKFFKIALNTMHEINSILKIKNNKQLNDLIKKFPLNLDNLNVDDLTNSLVEGLKEIKNSMIKNKIQKIEHINSEKFFPKKTKTFSLRNKYKNDKNNNNNLFGDLNLNNNVQSYILDNFHGFNLFNDDKEMILSGQNNNRIKSNNIIRLKNKENIDNNKENYIREEEELSLNKSSESLKDNNDNKEKNDEINIVNSINDCNINKKNKINKENKKYLTNMHDDDINNEKNEFEISLSEDEQECSEKNIPLNQKPLNRKIYSSLIKKMCIITEKSKSKGDINISEKKRATKYDNILNKLLVNLEEKIKQLKISYIETLIKRHLEKIPTKKKDIILRADLPKKRNELKKVYREILKIIKNNLEKENQDYYLHIILQILKKYEIISDNELDSELKIKKNKNNIKSIKKNNKKNCKNGCAYNFFLLIIIFLIPLIFAAFFIYNIFEIKIINKN